MAVDGGKSGYASTSSGGGGSGGGILLAAGKVDLQTGYKIYARGAKGNSGTNVYRPGGGGGGGRVAILSDDEFSVQPSGVIVAGGDGGYNGEPGTFYDGDRPSILIAPGLVITVY